jgi:hypothetical protein
MDDLSKTIEYNGPTVFSAPRVAAEPDLFLHRAALFYTPTENIPEKWVGSGPLDVTLPIPTPSYYEFFELRGYRSPRVWVDLLQRASGKLRWRPLAHPKLTIIRYDSMTLPSYAEVGAKALRDALKVRTTGRSDGMLLYYFGAIFDDDPSALPAHEFVQQQVMSPAEARTRIIVA